MDKKQFEIICKKLDKISAVIAIQKLEDNADKIYVLKQAGLGSKEIGDLIGLKESSVRTSAGWKEK
jgi:hypothetical protein